MRKPKLGAPQQEVDGDGDEDRDQHAEVQLGARDEDRQPGVRRQQLRLRDQAVRPSSACLSTIGPASR